MPRKKKEDDKLKGVNKDGESLFQPDKGQYDTLKNIVGVHAEYLMESFAKSVAVLETRIEIAEAMEESREVIYYTGALEQSRVYMDMLYRSVIEIEDWCGVKTVVIDAEGNVVDAKKNKKIKRIPVKDDRPKPKTRKKTIKKTTAKKTTAKKPKGDDKNDGDA